MSRPLIITLVVLAVAAALEGVLAGRNPRTVLASLRQPSWSPPFGLWLAIGFLFYAIFGAILFRALRQQTAWGAIAIVLVIAILLANGGWNYLLFRRRDLQAACRALLPYGALIAALFLVLLARDRTAALILFPYMLYTPFAYAWVRSLDRLNPASGR